MASSYPASNPNKYGRLTEDMAPVEPQEVRVSMTSLTIQPTAAEKPWSQSGLVISVISYFMNCGLCFVPVSEQQ
jgi:hypothetical protein